ncbi:MAG: caspase family protein [Bacteroidales bacterium]|nr:caspase family protein [Bacteroidales bacterium]
MKRLLTLLLLFLPLLCMGQYDKGQLPDYWWVHYDVNTDPVNGTIILAPMTKQSWKNDHYETYLKDTNYRYYGLYSAEKAEIIPPTKYELIQGAAKNLYLVRIGKYYGYVDGMGKVLLEPDKYTAIQKQLDGIHVKKGKYEGLLDSNMQVIIEADRYTSVSKRHDGYYSVSKGNFVGMIGPNLKLIIEADKYTAVDILYHENTIRFLVKQGDKYGILDESAATILPARYDKIEYANGGLFLIGRDGKWGYAAINDGTIAIPVQYDNATAFNDGVARVTKDGKSELLPNPLTVTTQNNKAKTPGKALSSYPAPDSEVDKNIPEAKTKNENTFAFIIANENYPGAKVPYALNDGWIFEEYCKKTLGIKPENVKLYEDATGGNIMACVEQMKQLAKAYDGDATIIFYYAGHAFPDEESKSAYLLPIDGDSKNIATGYSLDKLYKELNNVPAKQIICFLDACFSGATRDDQMLLEGRGVAIKVKEEVPQGNMVVFTSATGAETAHQYEEKHHGLFTYYLLEKLQQTQGNVTLGELSTHVTKMVKRKSVLINQKMQTPTVVPSPALHDTWQNINLNQSN